MMTRSSSTVTVLLLMLSLSTLRSLCGVGRPTLVDRSLVTATCEQVIVQKLPIVARLVQSVVAAGFLQILVVVWQPAADFWTIVVVHVVASLQPFVSIVIQASPILGQVLLDRRRSSAGRTRRRRRGGGSGTGLTAAVLGVPRRHRCRSRSGTSTLV